MYDVTDSHYEWANDNLITQPAPKLLKRNSLDTSTLTSGHEYYINFFVRDHYGPGGADPTTNTAILTLEFTAP